ncbi:MAG: hypothetical protein WDW38_010767 [Sanguina aurantia]
MLHSTIIASASDYFKLHLTTVVGKDSLGNNTVAVAPKYDLSEEVDPDQMESAAAVLELMYTHQLPAEASVRMMLSMLQISDRWMTSGCVDVIHKALASLPPSSFSLLDATAIYQTSAELRAAPGFGPALKAAGQPILEVYKNVVAVLSSPSLTEGVLQLPQPALLYLLDSDDLITDFEDSVLVMVSWWLEGPVGRSSSRAEVEELKGAIRYSRLSTTYLVQVLHQLPKLRPSEVRLLELVGYQTLGAEQAPKFFAGQRPGETMPAGWLKPARAAPAGPSASITIDLDVSRAQLETHIAELRASATNAADDVKRYISSAGSVGTRFTTSLNLFSKRSVGNFNLSVELYAPLPTAKGRMILPRGALCNYSFTMQGNQGRYPRTLTPSRFVSSSGAGLTCLPQTMSKLPGDPLALSWWSPLLIDGAVRLSALVTPL